MICKMPVQPPSNSGKTLTVSLWELFLPQFQQGKYHFPSIIWPTHSWSFPDKHLNQVFKYFFTLILTNLFFSLIAKDLGCKIKERVLVYLLARFSSTLRSLCIRRKNEAERTKQMKRWKWRFMVAFTSPVPDIPEIPVANYLSLSLVVHLILR